MSTIQPVFTLPFVVGLISLQILTLHTVADRCVCCNADTEKEKGSEFSGSHQENQNNMCVCVYLYVRRLILIFHYGIAVCLTVFALLLAPSVGWSGDCCCPDFSLLITYGVLCYFESSRLIQTSFTMSKETWSWGGGGCIRLLTELFIIFTWFKSISKQGQQCLSDGGCCCILCDTV